MRCAECPCFVSNRHRDMYSCLLGDSDDDEAIGIKYGLCHLPKEEAERLAKNYIENVPGAENYLYPNYGLKKGVYDVT